MPSLIPALAGALVVAGLIGAVIGLRRTPAGTRNGPRRQSRVGQRWGTLHPRTRILLLVGLALGVVGYLLSGWLIVLALGPLAAVGLPAMLTPTGSATRIDKLEALEEWTRSLAGVLTVGVGLEEALRATLSSTPAAIRPEVATLVARLRARMSTEEALRAFADDLDDATGDMVASFLILGSRRRGQGLAAVLNTLAENVAADVRTRRAVEADRAKPRATARWVTLITAGALVLLAFSGSYIAPYGTPVGQLALVGFLSVYVALLLWMRQMAKGEKPPRFLGTTIREGARS